LTLNWSNDGDCLILPIKQAFLKRFLKISGIFFLVLLILLVTTAVLIRTEWAQNLLVHEATKRLSKSLKTEIQVERVRFSLFNRVLMEGTLVRDQNRDTLLYAGTLKLSITDWFFMKNEAELQYLGLEDATIRMHRSDSTWNYQFLADYFSTPGKPRDTSARQMNFMLKRVELENVRFSMEDGWVGQDMVTSLGYLDLNAEEINLEKKKIFISSIELREPSFMLRNYDGNRPSGRTRKAGPAVRELADGSLQWNPADWDMLVRKVVMRNGRFRNEVQTDRAPFAYFDGAHIDFSKIDAQFDNLSWQKDTISAEIRLSTKERSGFTVNSLRANLKMHPKAMIFEKLDIRTPYSRLTDYYAMRYEDFNLDMGNYLEKVSMEGRFRNSTISARDIAYFAPELQGREATIRISGNASGTVSNLTARNMNLQYGKDTKLQGSIKLAGLPDIEKTYIDFRSDEFRTTYAEAIQLAPEIRDIKDPDFSALGFASFSGTYTGFIRDFVAHGTLQTGLGNIRTDLNMKLPSGKLPFYSGTVETDGFNLGKFLRNDQVGSIAFSGGIRGTGFDLRQTTAELNGTVRSVVFNQYTYQNVTVTGTLNKQEFNGEAIVDDPNLKARLDGYFNLNNADEPEYNLMLDVQRGNLREINLTKTDMNVLGKFRLNFKGRTIDDFIGEASLYDVALTQRGQVYVFDTLHLYSMKIDQQKQIEIYNSDVYISLNGIFNISDLPNTVYSYLNKYYPRYFDAPKKAIAPQDFVFKARLMNIDQYLPLLVDGIRGFDRSEINGSINTSTRSFVLNANVPGMSVNDIDFRGLTLEGLGDMDSLRLFTRADNIIVNDSLQIPAAALSIRSSADKSDISLTTSASQQAAYANLSLSMMNLSDGVRLHFNPSSFVINEKTWRIEKDGELTISRSFIDAQGLRLVNGRQEILVSSLPSEIGNSNDILISLNRVNLGDLLPYVLKQPKIEGITSGDITIEDPYNRLKVYVNAQTDQTRFEDDSIGITTVNAFWDNSRKKATFFLSSNNLDYVFDVKGAVYLADSSNRIIDTDIDITGTRVDILENYLGIIFSDMNGIAKGKLRISGNLEEPDLTGKVTLKDAGVMVDYTRCYYSLENPEITFRPDQIDIGNIRIRDIYGNEGTVSGSLTHHFFRDFTFNFNATSKKMLLLNTGKLDNSIFYGKAVGKVNFFFRGPEKEMQMYVIGEVVDSSEMSIVTSTASKSRGEADFIVWRQYGREMSVDSLKETGSNLIMDLDLTANNFLKMNVVLDELSGDVISARGNGSIKIHTATHDALTLNGRYNIERGNYNFNFQDIFKKPFVLEPGSGSYISWSGDPYDAEINIQASYTAEQVRMSTLFGDANSATVSGVSSDILREISDVLVQCRLTGTLSQPNPSFEIIMPANSPVKSNPTVDSRLKAINRDPLEVSKQSTYLIVFKSFAPQAAIVSSDINQELINNTISGVINSILASSVQNFFYKILGSSMDVNFNYSRISASTTGTTSQDPSTTSGDYRENVSLEFIKSLLNDKLVITFGSDFNFSTGNRSATGSQAFLFLPDVTVEYKITPDGKFRTSFFYRSSFDALSTSGRRDRTGGNISYRTEFDYLLPRKKRKQEELVVTDSSSSAILQK
jgi:hypothetical protein